MKHLRHPEQPPTDDEVQTTVLQFARMVRGYRPPSHKDRAAFEQAVAAIVVSTCALLETLEHEPS